MTLDTKQAALRELTAGEIEAIAGGYGWSDFTDDVRGAAGATKRGATRAARWTYRQANKPALYFDRVGYNDNRTSC